jgi:hypothetical protein
MPLVVTSLPTLDFSCQRNAHLYRLNKQRRRRRSEANGHTKALPLAAIWGACPLHPDCREFIRFSRDLRHGVIERLGIQDGLSVLEETTRKRVKLTR